MEMSLGGKKVLVIGLGESGFGAALLLRDLGADVRVTDVKCDETTLSYFHLLPPVGIEVELGNHSKKFYQGVDFAILSPGIPRNISLLSWLHDDHIPVLGELEWASRFISGKIIAITGSNGKSTTSTLIWKLLKDSGRKSSLAGNIGRSLSRAILEDVGTQYWVLEMSSYQLEMVETFKPWISMLLNLTPNHLDHYASFEDYIHAKMGIFRNQVSSDWALLHSSVQSRVKSKARTLVVNPEGMEKEGVYLHEGRVKLNLEGITQELFSSGDIYLPGIHNLENVMFASGAAVLCGVPLESIHQSVSGFKGLEHRQEEFGVWHGVSWVNDSKSTSVDAVRTALETCKAPIYWIAGGRFKGGDFASLNPWVSKKVKEAHFYGEAGSILEKCFKGVCPIFTHGSLKDAIDSTKDRAKSGDTVLLSPGCSSFDQFKNFEERGTSFKKWVSESYIDDHANTEKCKVQNAKCKT